jgi:hypothetical protein
LKDSEADGIRDLYEYLMGLNPKIDDAQGDLDLDGLVNINEYLFGSYANISDTDNDGMDDLFEFNEQLNPVINDASDDRDQDGLTNYEEYLIGSSIGNNDTDGDTMDDYYEYQMGLNLLENDANKDKDGDWVSNVLEYHENCDASNFWSVPLFYSDFPFICLSFVHALFFAVILFSGFFGGTGSYLYKNQKREKLRFQTGAPDYETALLIRKGHFPDYNMFKKASELNISFYEEYQFMLEQIDLEQQDNENNK